MKKIGLLLTAILLSPLAMAQTAPTTPKAQAPQTWYVAPSSSTRPAKPRRP